MARRVVVLASGRGSNLKALLEEPSRGYEVVGVVCDRPAIALELAREHQIADLLVPFTSPRLAWNRELAREVNSFKPDLVVLAGFMRILSADFLGSVPKTINIHPSLLPLFPGAHAVRDALQAAVDVTGCTVHEVDAGVDTGPVLAQMRVNVVRGETEELLHRRIQEAEHRLLPAVVNSLTRC